MPGHFCGGTVAKHSVVLECFENQRFTKESLNFSSDNLTSQDPQRFVNRLQQGGCDYIDNWPCPKGWQWVGNWRVDVSKDEGDEEAMWMFGFEFKHIERAMLLGFDANGVSELGLDGQDSGSIEVRSRRWYAHTPRFKQPLGTPF